MIIRALYHLSPSFVVRKIEDVEASLRRMWDALHPLRQGKIECVVQFTLTANAASSVLTDIRLSNQTLLCFDPMTANASVEKANGTMYALETNRGNGSVTISHANNAQADRTFLVALIG
jgi:hypothetical protein